VLSVNRGVPLMIAQPNHPFAQQITQIADRLIEKPGRK
jgi:MinD-like ATPase involved in chromosome partitioning or flagellar assembly